MICKCHMICNNPWASIPYGYFLYYYQLLNICSKPSHIFCKKKMCKGIKNTNSDRIEEQKSNRIVEFKLLRSSLMYSCEFESALDIDDTVVSCTRNRPLRVVALMMILRNLVQHRYRISPWRIFRNALTVGAYMCCIAFSFHPRLDVAPSRMAHIMR